MSIGTTHGGKIEDLREGQRLTAQLLDFFTIACRSIIILLHHVSRGRSQNMEPASSRKYEEGNVELVF